MKLSFNLFFAATLAVTPAVSAGTIVGRVHAEGKQGADDPNCATGNYDSRAYKFAAKVDYATMHDFVVYLEGPVAASKSALTNLTAQVVTKREVTQHKAMFYPHVLPVMVGTTVEWPNNDDIYHNVFSYSEACPFDLGLYKNTDKPKPVTFSTVGRVDVFCSIHSSMNCVVLVLENPYFTTSNEKGQYSIPNVPAGTYKLKAWHERLPAQRQEIIVPESGEVKVDFTLGISGLPKI
jgi:plastocyanin